MMQRIAKTLITFALLSLIGAALAEEPEKAPLTEQARELLNSIDDSFGAEGLARIDISKEYSAWGIDHYGQVWRWDGVQWAFIDSDGQDIGAGGDYVYLTRSDDSIWIWNGTEFAPFWWARDPYLEKVDAGADGSLWGIEANGNIFYWDGLSWNYLGDKGSDISIDLDTGNDTVYVTRTDGTSWALDKETWQWTESNWTRRSIATRTIER